MVFFAYMEEKETSQTDKEKKIVVQKEHKPKTYTWEEFKQLFRNGINT